MKRNARTFLALAALFASSAAYAAPSIRLFTKDGRTVCESDIRALCVNVQRTDLQACLIGNADAIVDMSCKAVVRDAKNQIADIMHSCEFDIDTKCSGLDFDSGLLECLAGRRRELLGACRAAL